MISSVKYRANGEIPACAWGGKAIGIIGLDRFVPGRIVNCMMYGD
jgi:hypothetical protein